MSGSTATKSSTIGASATGMFHLLTHAFFKATLFLAAGILIHALAGEQDLRKMGGLRKVMPFTFVAFLAGGLALAAIPPFSGFFSKDPLLAAALDDGNLGYVLFVNLLFGYIASFIKFIKRFEVTDGSICIFITNSPAFKHTYLFHYAFCFGGISPKFGLSGLVF